MHEYRQNRLKGKCLLLLLMMLLFSFLLFLNRAEASAEIEYVPKGWNSPTEGYWMTEQAGRDILTGWKIDREQKDIYMNALETSEQRLTQLKEVVSEEFANIKMAHDKDRAQWQKELRRARLPGIGVFAGLGYTTSEKIEGVAGVGIVWKIW